MIRALAVEGYRSLRRLILPLGPLTVVTGANGAGKSNLYRSLRLLADASRQGAVAALAAEGGMASALWAGDRTGGRGAAGRPPIDLRLGFASDDLSYALVLGVGRPRSTPFDLEPRLTREAIWSGPRLQRSTLLVERSGPAVSARDRDGGWTNVAADLRSFDSVLAELGDPDRTPEVIRVRDRLRGWRFYDQLRTDRDAPVRRPAVATTTPVLAADGADLAPAIRTIEFLRGSRELEAAIDAGLPGARVEIVAGDGHAELLVHQPGLRRPLRAAELSDGTLRYLLWVAALLSPRPPELLVLNEPETSLHPDLIAPLATLIAGAAEHDQVVVVSHAPDLVDRLAATRPGGEAAGVVELTRTAGVTGADGQGPLDEPPWSWP